jgi:hypothetical protein
VSNGNGADERTAVASAAQCTGLTSIAFGGKPDAFAKPTFRVTPSRTCDANAEHGRKRNAFCRQGAKNGVRLCTFFERLNAMNEPITQAEANSVAVDLANDFGRLLNSYQAIFKLTREQALARATKESDDDASRILDRPPDQTNWYDLRVLAEKQPEQFFKRWQAVKQAALDELRSGDRAARVVETPNHQCWQRAQFLALRAELSDSLQPVTGIERPLIDTMAQALTAYHFWLHYSMLRASMECATDKQLHEEGRWLKPRVDDAEAVEQATMMADRFNKMFLRTLRALRDLRRYNTPVIIRKANQVNIARKQVNMAAAGPAPESNETPDAK